MNRTHSFRIHVLLLTVLIGFALLSGSLADPNSDKIFVDPRDSERYGTVVIGDKVWMTRNLNFTSPNSVCYDNKSENCEKLGRLYIFEEAMTACPAGWSLPSPEDVDALHKILGKRIDRMAAKHEWQVKKADKITNESGLTILPAGRYDFYIRYSKEEKAFIDTMTFHQLGIAASYWLNATETDKGLIHWHLGTPIGERKSGMHRHHIVHDTHRFSVRCVCEND